MRVTVLISDRNSPPLPIHAVVVILDCLTSTPQREGDDRKHVSRDSRLGCASAKTPDSDDREDHVPLADENLVDKRRSHVHMQSHASDFKLRSIVTLAFPTCYCQRMIALGTYRIMSRESKGGISRIELVVCRPDAAR